jgi:hypothetical protein
MLLLLELFGRLVVAHLFNTELSGGLIMKLDLIRHHFAAVLIVSAFMKPAWLHAGTDAVDAIASVEAGGNLITGENHAREATADREQAQQSVNMLSKDIQTLKQSVIALNKNLRVLEEDMLFPANTRFSVFLSLDVGKFFTLESVKLKIDGKVVASHIYSDKERKALSRGGIHRLHMANLSMGEHTLSAFFTGIGPSGREYKRGTTLKVNKESGSKYVELGVTDSTMKQQPEFSVRQW